MSATRRDVARALSDRLDTSQRESGRWLRATLESLVDVLVQEGRLELRGFGSFEVRRIEEQHTVDPRTGEPVVLSPTYTVDFKPGKNLRQALEEDKK